MQFLAAARIIVGPPISMFSMSVPHSAPWAATFAKGYDCRSPKSRMGSIPSSDACCPHPLHVRDGTTVPTTPEDRKTRSSYDRQMLLDFQSPLELGSRSHREGLQSLRRVPPEETTSMLLPCKGIGTSAGQVRFCRSTLNRRGDMDTELLEETSEVRLR